MYPVTSRRRSGGAAGRSRLIREGIARFCNSKTTTLRVVYLQRLDLAHVTLSC